MPLSSQPRVIGRFVEVTANVTAAPGDKYLADTSGGTFTITLPTNPSDGDIVQIGDPKGTWATSGKNLTIARNGKTIKGQAKDLVCNLSNHLVLLTYSTADADWAVFVSR